MALVTFLVMHATPGSPLDPVAEGANPLPPEAQRNLATAYRLDTGGPLAPGSFGEPDLRLANRDGARISAAE